MGGDVSQVLEALRRLREEVEALKRTVVQMRLDDLGALVNEILVRRSLLYARRLLREELLAIRASADPSCPHRNACLKAVEEGMDEVLNRLLLGGLEEALRALEERELALKGILTGGACSNAACLERTAGWMGRLRETLEVARRFASLGEQVAERVREGIGEVAPESLASLAEPLAHPARVRLLRLLKEGPLPFSELAARTGLRSGHLKFHLTKLVRAGYVAKLGGRAGYAITRLGADALRALELLHALRKDYLTLEGVRGGGPIRGGHNRAGAL